MNGRTEVGTEQYSEQGAGASGKQGIGEPLHESQAGYLPQKPALANLREGARRPA